MYYNQARFVGQAVKTPPSHGGNRGSIPLLTVGRMPDIQVSFSFLGKEKPSGRGRLQDTEF